jgi:hypothetical protein
MKTTTLLALLLLGLVALAIAVPMTESDDGSDYDDDTDTTDAGLEDVTESTRRRVKKAGCSLRRRTRGGGGMEDEDLEQDDSEEINYTRVSPAQDMDFYYDSSVYEAIEGLTSPAARACPLEYVLVKGGMAWREIAGCDYDGNIQ